METGDCDRSSEWGHDAQWADELHHALHVLLTGERDGYYEPLRERRRPRPPVRTAPSAAARRLRAEPRPGRQPRVRRPPAAAPSCAWPRSARLRAGDAARCSWARSTARRNPFQFFTDHIDPAIAEATREGRRREFARFAAFAGEDVPDPQARSRRSSARSSIPSAATPSTATTTASCSRCAATPACRARSRPTSTRKRRVLRVRRGDVELAHELLADERRGRPAVDGSGPMTTVWPGYAVPARRALGRQGHELLALLRERRAGRALPLRRRRPTRRASS